MRSEFRNGSQDSKKQVRTIMCAGYLNAVQFIVLKTSVCDEYSGFTAAREKQKAIIPRGDEIKDW